jgi:hypothetical protein
MYNIALSTDVAWLFLLAIPIACISWTVTHEEIFREPREYCQDRAKAGSSIWERKFFYLFTCEYCFSHYVTIAALLFTRYKFLLADWRGYILAGFGLVWIANVYMSIFAVIRALLKEENLGAKLDEKKLSEADNKTDKTQ